MERRISDTCLSQYPPKARPGSCRPIIVKDSRFLLLLKARKIMSFILARFVCGGRLLSKYGPFALIMMMKY